MLSTWLDRQWAYDECEAYIDRTLHLMFDRTHSSLVCWSLATNLKNISNSFTIPRWYTNVYTWVVKSSWNIKCAVVIARLFTHSYFVSRSCWLEQLKISVGHIRRNTLWLIENFAIRSNLSVSWRTVTLFVIDVHVIHINEMIDWAEF